MFSCIKGKKMNKTLLALLVLGASSYAQAESNKDTYNASSCELKYGNAEIDYSKGTVTNRSPNYDILYCSIPMRSGVDVQDVSVNMYLSDMKERQSSNCFVTFYSSKSTAVLSNSKTSSAEAGLNLLATGSHFFGSEDARGVLTCNVPGVEEGGLVRYSSYSIEYL